MPAENGTRGGGARCAMPQDHDRYKDRFGKRLKGRQECLPHLLHRLRREVVRQRMYAISMRFNRSPAANRLPGA